MTRYLVTGRAAYLEHQPGQMLETDLPRDQEERAVALGALQVIDRTPTRLQPGSWTLPQPAKEDD